MPGFACSSPHSLSPAAKAGVSFDVFGIRTHVEKRGLGAAIIKKNKSIECCPWHTDGDPSKKPFNLSPLNPKSPE